MRIVQVDFLRPGTFLARDLLDEHGHILLNRGVKLTEGYIRALKSKGFQQVYIRDTEDEPDVQPEEDISQATRAKAFKAIKNSFELIESELAAVKSSSMQEIQQALESDRVRALMGAGGVIQRLQESVDRIMEEVLTRSTLAGLTSIKSANSALYEHSIDVCVVSLFLGQALNQPPNRLRQLATGCLLHDVGMIFVPKGLPESARIRQHTRLGYELLKTSEQSDILAPHVAYEHHEHQDGTGQPRGLRGSNSLQRDRSISGPVPTLIGEIAAVANTYDNLLSGADGKTGLAPDQALQRIRAAAGSVLNRELVNAFVRLVPVYPVGSAVTVAAGAFKHYYGVVTEVHSGELDRPTIALYRDASGKSIEPMEIDLRQRKEVRIKSQLH